MRRVISNLILNLHRLQGLPSQLIPFHKMTPVSRTTDATTTFHDPPQQVCHGGWWPDTEYQDTVNHLQTHKPNPAFQRCISLTDIASPSSSFLPLPLKSIIIWSQLTNSMQGTQSLTPLTPHPHSCVKRVYSTKGYTRVKVTQTY